MKDQNNANFTPMGISISPDGKFLYVANNASNSVSKIDLSTGQIVATRQMGKDPYTTWISHDGNALYVSNWGESSVTVRGRGSEDRFWYHLPNKWKNDLRHYSGRLKSFRIYTGNSGITRSYSSCASVMANFEYTSSD